MWLQLNEFVIKQFAECRHLHPFDSHNQLVYYSAADVSCLLLCRITNI